MRKIALTLIMSFSFLGLFAQTTYPFKIVDAQQFAKYVGRDDVTLLDVRTSGEYSEGHIPGTDFNIDVLQDSFTAEAEKSLPKDKPVALYCRSGNRSKNAAKILSTKGYEVVELGTGFRGWCAAGFEVAK